jgi:hypothetical protein
MRIWSKLFGAVAIVALSFVYTSGAMEFIDFLRGKDKSEFSRALTGAGLMGTASITGHVDSVRRGLDRRLVLTGWAYDKELGKPVSIFVFLNGKFEQVAISKGARPDVTAALGLPSQRTKDVAFSGQTEQAIDCRVSSDFSVIAVNQNKKYSALGYVYRIPGCQG